MDGRNFCKFIHRAGEPQNTTQYGVLGNFGGKTTCRSSVRVNLCLALSPPNS